MDKEKSISSLSLFVLPHAFTQERWTISRQHQHAYTMLTCTLAHVGYECLSVCLPICLSVCFSVRVHVRQRLLQTTVHCAGAATLSHAPLDPRMAAHARVRISLTLAL